MNRPHTETPAAPLVRRGGAPLFIGVATLLLFAGVVVRLAVLKFYSIDELTYAHAAWSVGQGLVPFRDFFFHHTPLLLQLGGAVLGILDDDPANIAHLRLLMLPVFALICWLSYLLNREWATVAALLAPVFVLATPLVATMATEYRPDPLAFALALAAVVLLRASVGTAGFRAAGAGALLAAGIWASEKVAVYGLAFLLAWLSDLRKGGPESSRLTLRPRAFFLGGAAMASVAAAYLSLSSSWPAFWRWGIRWPLVHQEHYPGFPWPTYFTPFVRESWWILALALAGAAASARALGSRDRVRSHPDTLLLLLLATTFTSFAAQKSAYPYSLVPFAVLAAIFAARGAAAVYDLVGSRIRGLGAARALRAGLVLALAAVLSLAWLELRERGADDNSHQHEVLARLHHLTTPDDPVYDNSGGYVARPHVSFFFFTDATVRRLLPDLLVREMPAAILRSGCTVFMPDIRFPSLPSELRSFVLTHFQPYDGDIYLWGQRYDAGDPGAAGTLSTRAEFLAVRDAVYFVEPGAVVSRGSLAIDGRRLDRPEIRLAAGIHRLEYSGPDRQFYLLWLPRDGNTWTPRPGLPVRFSRLF